MAIDVTGLSKSYRSVRAVDDISFTVQSGELFAFLGSNGAGKSTTIGCLTTLRRFDAGEVRVAGHDVRSEGEMVRRSIGVVFQESLLDPDLTALENLRLRGQLSGVPRRRVGARIAELSELIGLQDILPRRYGRLSGGQRRRVDIARALIHDPEILFLDEPTAGLDPASRSSAWSTVQTLRREHGLTVFLTTHYMEETEQADRVCIISAGQLVAQGTPSQLRARYSHSILRVRSARADALLALCGQMGVDAHHAGDACEITVDGSAQAREILARHGDDTLDFEFRHGRMDDVFLAVTGDAPSETMRGVA